jgi:hypothetical protein
MFSDVSKKNVSWEEIYMFFCVIIGTIVSFSSFSSLLLREKAKTILRISRKWVWRIFSDNHIDVTSITPEFVLLYLNKTGESLDVNSIPQFPRFTWSIISRIFSAVVDDYLKLYIKVSYSGDIEKSMLKHMKVSNAAQRLQSFRELFRNSEVLNVDIIVITNIFKTLFSKDGASQNVPKIRNLDLPKLSDKVASLSVHHSNEILNSLNSIFSLLTSDEEGFISSSKITAVILIMFHSSVNHLRLILVLFSLFDHNCDNLLDKNQIHEYFECFACLIVHFMATPQTDRSDDYFSFCKKMVREISAQSVKLLFSSQHFETIAIEDIINFHLANRWFGCFDFKTCNLTRIIQSNHSQNSNSLIYTLYNIQFAAHFELLQLRNTLMLSGHSFRDFTEFVRFMKPFNSEAEEDFFPVDSNVTEKCDKLKPLECFISLNEFKRILDMVSLKAPLRSFYSKDEVHHTFFRLLFSELETFFESNIICFKSIACSISFLFMGNFREKLSIILEMYSENGLISVRAFRMFLISCISTISTIRLLKSKVNSKILFEWRNELFESVSCLVQLIYEGSTAISSSQCFERLISIVEKNTEFLWVKSVNILEFI